MSLSRSSATPSPADPAFAALLARLDARGPRYTSYPTADRFVEAYGRDDHERALRTRRDGPLSIYVHVPFCASACWYCACNKVVTRRHERAGPFLDDLAAEIARHVAVLGSAQAVTQVHLGGGTPTFLDDAEIARLVAMLHAGFAIASHAERSIEVDPRTVDAGRLRLLASLGFDRISFGVQDVDPTVQAAIHRVQPLERVRALMESARAIGFASINVDLIHGLPRQTPTSFARTVEAIRALRPDRIALYAYAHLPQRFKPQRRIDAAALPSPVDRVAMLACAIERFEGAGYDYVGMDHFALPDDALAIARRQGRLHRDFQGYGTQPEGDLVGLGPSAISRIGPTYAQNERALADWHDAVSNGRLATARGIALTRDDLVRRAVILALMCQGRVEFEAIELAHLVDFRAAFAAELRRLAPLAEDGLVTIGPDAIEVTTIGRYVVRQVAMTFDRFLAADRDRQRYSRIA